MLVRTLVDFVSTFLLSLLLTHFGGKAGCLIQLKCPRRNAGVGLQPYCSTLLQFCGESGNSTCEVERNYSLLIMRTVVATSTNVTALSNSVEVKLSPVVPNGIGMETLFNFTKSISITISRKERMRGVIVGDTLVSVHLINLTALMRRGLLLPCDTFDRSGDYELKINSTYNDGDFLLSDHCAVRVYSSNDYLMQMRSDRLFPCEANGISISAEVPRCSTRKIQHHIRLLAVERRQSVLGSAWLRRNIYLTEKTLKPGKSVVQFGCDRFDLIHPEYCFQLVSTHSDGYVQVHLRKCVPTELRNRLAINGQWSSWNPWGSCTDDCNSVRHRTRQCDNPSPQFGGAFCNGSAMEIASCNSSIDCQKRYVNTSVSIYNDQESCKCGGCTLTSSPGTIVLFSYNCRSPIYWYVSTGDNDTWIQWRVVTMKLRRGIETLRIIDGNSSHSPILFDSNNANFYVGRIIVTSGALSRVELLKLGDYSSSNSLEDVGVFKYHFVSRKDVETHASSEERLYRQRRLLEMGLAAFAACVLFIFAARAILWHWARGETTVDKGKYEERNPVKMFFLNMGLMQSSICRDALLSSDVRPASIAIKRIDEGAEDDETTVSWSKRKLEDSVSFADVEQEFEYDYYDAPILGSILNPLDYSEFSG